MATKIITENTTTGKLFEIARENGIEIVKLPIHREAMAVKYGGEKYIVLNEAERSEEETARILREMIKAHICEAYTGTVSEKVRA